MNKSSLIIGIMAVMSLGSCSTINNIIHRQAKDTPAPAAPVAPVTETTVVSSNQSVKTISGKWALIEINGRELTINGDNRPTFTFTAAPDVAGAVSLIAFNGCNYLNGTYLVGENKLVPQSEIISSLMACPDAPYEYEVNQSLANNDRILRDTDFGQGRKVVTFANVLNHGVFPLAKIIDFMLSTGQYEMGRPVEIEFAGNINPDAMRSDKKGTVYWLQIRPIVDKKEMLDDSLLDVADEDLILRSGTALGHGLMDNVRHIVYVKPTSFDSSQNVATALEVEKINKEMVEKGLPYILIGPGRWGSSDSALGIPVKWPQIAGARLIVESALPGYRIEPSQGTHFFQNLTSFGVGYFTIDQPGNSGMIDTTWLDSQPAVYESDKIRIVEFADPLSIAINGRKSKGIVVKPGKGKDA